MKNKYSIFVGIGILIYVLLFSFLSFQKYRAFEYHDFDLAAHTQTLWSIVRGSLYCSILGVDFLGNHCHFILFLIAPVFALFSHPLTILFLQSLALGLTAWPIYLIAKDRLDAKLGWLTVFLYLIYPALAYANLYEFHPTAFATFFLAMTLLFFLRNNFTGFCLFMVLSLLCQENIAFGVFMIGIWAIFLKQSRRFILTPILASILWFMVCYYIVMPYFGRGQIKLISFYSHMGQSPPEIMAGIFQHPIKFIVTVFSRDNLVFILQLFAPLCFLPLLSYEGILLVLPFLLQHLLSSRFTEKLLVFHYAAEMLPFIFLGFIFGLRRFKERFGLSDFSRLLLVIFAVFFAIYIGPLAYLGVNAHLLRVSRLDTAKQELIKEIPADSGAVATFELLSHLAMRRELFSFHNVILGLYPYSQKPFLLPDSVDFVLVDFDDSLTRYYFNAVSLDKKVERAINLRRFCEDKRFGIMEIRDSLVLFKRGLKSGLYLFKMPGSVPKDIVPTRVIIEDTIEFLGQRFRPDAKGDFVIELYWRCLKPSQKEFNFYITVTDASGRVVETIYKNICYGAYPTYMWEAGQVIGERYSIIIPSALPKGNFTVKLGFVEMGKRFVLLRFLSGSQHQDQNGNLVLGNVTIK
ncbi:MAG: DUF2079 domain-containing protein [Candidatus Omnitrophota bacterium]